MPTILDVELHHRFWGDLESAEKAAQKEAANTGGAVIRVETVEIRTRAVSFIGSIPEAALGNGLTPIDKDAHLGSFHTTWGAVMSPNQVIGFLVARQPIHFKSFASSTDNLGRVSVTLGRTFESIPDRVLGQVRCRRCLQPIAPERLSAKPGVHYCTACQASKEEAFNGN